MSTGASWIGCVLTAAVVACGRPPTGDPFTLNRNLENARTLEVYVEPGEAHAWARELARSVEPWDVSVLALGESGDGGAPRTVIAPANAQGLEPLFDRMGELAAEVGLLRGMGRDALERLAREPESVLIATFDDPERPGQPLTLAVGATSVDALAVLGDLTPCARPTFRWFRRGELEREGELFARPDGTPPPVFDISIDRGVERANERERPEGPLTFRFGADFDDDRADQYARACAAGLERLRELLLEPGEQPAAPIEVHLRANLERHARFASTAGLATRGPFDDQVHALLQANVADDRGAEVARAFALRTLGRTFARWLVDGVGLEVAGAYHGRPLDEWIAHLSRGGFAPTVAELVDPRNRMSPHVRAPLSAMLVRVVRELRGKAGVRALWRGQAELDADVEAAWRVALERNLRVQSAALEQNRRTRLQSARERPFRNGIVLTEPDVDPRVRFVGFGTIKSAESAARARAVGATASTMFFDAYVLRSLPRFAGERARASGFASTSDLELFVGASLVRRVLPQLAIRPNLLASPSANLAGWAMLNSSDHWPWLFGEIARCAEHYGLLAELVGAEVYCIAGEIPGASVTKQTEQNLWEHGQLGWRRAQWSTVIQRARASFGGALTFAAESGYEARGIEFWEELDFLGIELYPTVARADQVDFSRERAVQVFVGSLTNVAEIAENVGRPALVLECGISATSEGWRSLANPLGDVDGLMQQRVYDALADAMERARAKRVDAKGLFLWWWSTDPHAGGEEDASFTPLNKPAEATVGKVFRSP